MVSTGKDTMGMGVVVAVVVGAGVVTLRLSAAFGLPLALSILLALFTGATALIGLRMGHWLPSAFPATPMSWGGSGFGEQEAHWLEEQRVADAGDPRRRIGAIGQESHVLDRVAPWW